MHVLGISGTPRAGGNSDILLAHALEPFAQAGWEVEHVRLCDMTVAPCRGCDACRREGACVVDDDMAILYDAFSRCDALIISSPVYYRNVSASLLAVMQRHYGISLREPLRGVAGGAIAVGRGTGGGQAMVLNVIYTWMLSCGMICVPGELNGVTAVADAPGDILAQPKRLEQAAILGENVLHVARACAPLRHEGGRFARPAQS